ncbi:MAG: ElyC/SanA/YdcF family protein [Acidaminococcaceae bacterium]
MGIDEAADKYMVAIDDVPERVEYCIVLGALVKKAMTPLLKARLDAAIAIHKKRPATKFILSGCPVKRGFFSDVDVMYEYLTANSDIAASNLIKDYEGWNTLRSFKSLQNKKMANELMVVTNRFHLPRALYIAEKLGFSPYGITADPKENFDLSFFEDREIAASYKAWFNLHI